MNWLSRFSPKAATASVNEVVTPLPAATSGEVCLTQPQVFHGEIRHAQWIRKGGNCEITQDFFANPDMDSPLAGIIVDRFSNPSTISIQCVPRVGKVGEAGTLLKQHMLGGGVFLGVHPQEARGIESAGVNPPLHTIAMMMDMSGNGVDDPESRNFAVKRMTEIIKQIKDTPAFSANPAIREAIVSKMQEKLSALRTISLRSSTPGQTIK